MTPDDCKEIELLLQADFDGELDVAGTARVAAHLARCPHCQGAQAELANLSARLRSELPYHAAPDRLRQAVEAALAAEVIAPESPVQTRDRRTWFETLREGMASRWTQRGISFGAGAAIAAALAIFVVMPDRGDMAENVVDSHIRALQPGHLMDVISTDQHTVKPWFDGRLDYAPPVKDLAADGFPLIGGRLDYIAKRPVAALAYRHGQHVLDLYVWPSSRGSIAPSSSGEFDGYNYIRWNEAAMTLWAVSDISKADLDKFVDLWRAAQ